MDTSDDNAMARPVVVLIHGACGNPVMWNPVRRALGPGIEVIAPELPGHGSRRGQPFTLSEAVRTVAAAAASVAPRPVVLAGDSLGGFTCMASAAALPRDQLRGLVLSGCTMNFSGWQAMWPYWLRIGMFRFVLRFIGEEKFVRRKMPAGLRKLRMPEEDIEPVMAGGISLSVWEQAVHQLEGHDWLATLAAIEQPVWLLNGANDRDMMRDEPRFVAAARRGRRLVFDGEGHGVSVLRAAEFARLVNGFVAELGTTAA
jgi:pimeloyl-ACP methyl ester carboxylesterase